MTVIHQGDQYYIPILIESDGTAVTPEMVDDVKVRIADREVSYSSGELIYDETNGWWCYPMTEAVSSNITKNRVEAQIAAKVGDDYFYSAVQRIAVSYSVLSKWGNNEEEEGEP